MTSDPETQAAETVLQGLVRYLVDGWNQGNGHLFATPFADDADYIHIYGGYLKGREQIAAGHQHIFSTIYRDSHMEASIASLRFLSPEIALIHLRCTTRLSDQASAGAEKEIQSIPSLVAIKQGGKWVFTAFHNTRIGRGPDQ
jgi:uncharacterized protein (TIGR02246 family)